MRPQSGPCYSDAMHGAYPERIVCLTEETTETLYLLGEDARIVGISGFTVRPPRARREKPKVSAFISAKIDRIVALRPDLVLGFSDLQADIAARARTRRHRSASLQPPQRRGDPAHDPHARRHDRLRGEGVLARGGSRCRRRTGASSRVVAAAAAADLFRGMGRPVDSRHPLGRRNRRDRGRHQLLSGAFGDAARPRPNHRRSDGGRTPRPGHDSRIMVRQEVPRGAGRRAARLVGDTRGARRRAARDQVGDHPAAGSGRADRWARRNSRARPSLGRAPPAA